MTPEDRIEALDLLVTISAKHTAQIEALTRLAEKQAARGDEFDARLNAIVSAEEKRGKEQDERLRVLVSVAEVHEKRLDAVGEQITALRAAIADTDRRWQAYINTLPRQ